MFLPPKTALVLIDVQKWTLSMPTAPHPAEQVVGNCGRLAQAFRAAGSTVVLVRIGYSEGLADMLRLPVDLPAPLPVDGYPLDSMEFPAELQQVKADVLIVKRQWSAFFGTELDLQLRRRGLDTIVLGGLMTNFGVESTARDAWQNSYSVIVVSDATTSVTPELHQFSIEKILPRVSRVRPTVDVLAVLALTAAKAG
jgi:nicotinamidase-related amidase